MSYASHRGIGTIDKGTVQDINSGVQIASGIASGIASIVQSTQQPAAATFPQQSWETQANTNAPASSTDWTPWIIGASVIAVGGIAFFALRPPRGVKANRRRRR